jgi:FlaA1/EpsC-like NDP-sugar epimerase
MSTPSTQQRVQRFQGPLLLLTQATTCVFSVLSAFVFRFDANMPRHFRPHLQFALLVWPLVKLIVFRIGGPGRGWWRCAPLPDLFRVTLGNVVATMLVAAITLSFGPPGFPRSIYIIDLLVCLIVTSATRIGRRIHWEFSRARSRDAAEGRTLIYGAGDAGVSVLREIRQNSGLPWQVVGLIDDDPTKLGASIQGIRVLGCGEDLPALARNHGVRTVLVAMPSATGQQMTAILRQCHSAGVSFKTIPGLSKILENISLTEQIRDVAVEDLLGRSPVVLEHQRIRDRIGGRVVLVTGAAGSIGSELCRQIARYSPAAIVGFENSETGLFHLEDEMRKSFPGMPFHPEIGSIQNQRRVGEVIGAHRPAIIFHAAAYKHVPMMESHLFEALENNVFGSWNVASAAVLAGVEDFVLISSDKAVRPTNIMGATKRLSEFIILSFAEAQEPAAASVVGGTTRSAGFSGPCAFSSDAKTKFVAVRFGNVLGSNGSVVPMFKQQILAGGPVTVTHPEMERFFMTIPEASQLVLQASVMGNGGEVFVLDMGSPVKIVDLARNLILLSGLRPDEDIRIEFTGIRPGEKLCEELSHLEEGTVATQHEKVRVFAANAIRRPDMAGYLSTLRDACATRNTGMAIDALRSAIPDYSPSEHVLARVGFAHRASP